MGDVAQTFVIALGGNLPSQAGGPADTLRAGLSRLREETDGEIVASGFYCTPCFPAGAGPDYVNAAARLQFAGDAHALLRVLHRIEAEFGRARLARWGQRTLDLDLLAAGDLILPDRATHDHWRTLPAEEQIAVTPDQLLLPHPRLQDRAFVLVPLAQIAPDWVHPILGLSVVQMLAALPAEARAEIVPLRD